MQRTLLIALVLIFSAALACAERAPVAGKVAVAGKGLAGVKVCAWPLTSRSFTEQTTACSAASAADGTFALEVDPGEYYFIAEGASHFGYYGRNPVTVDAGGTADLKLNLSVKAPIVPEGAPFIESGVFGQASLEGKPLAGVVLTMYTDLNTQLKGMGFGMSLPSDERGYFEVPLGAGTYYLVARKRESGQFSGPLQAGDFFGYYAGNPLVIKEAEIARIGIDMVEVPQKIERLADSMFGQTSVHGRVLNAVGSPVAGVRVLLYSDGMMLNRPLYVSQPSNAQGEYVLSFPKGGTYFLAARNKLGGAPGPGELYGRYPGTQDSSIRIRTGQALPGIDLLVEEMW